MKHIELNNEVMKQQDGFFQLDKDQEAVKAFMEEVNENTVQFNSIKEKIDYLVENDFYYDVYQDYSIEQIEEIYQCVHSYDFQFQSYMAASKFYKDYAMKTNDKKKYLEHYPDRVTIVGLYLGQGDYNKARKLVEAMMEQRYQPATPTFLNAGKSRRGEMVSCFLLDIDDSLNSINFNLNTSMQLSKIGGGVALNLSKLRSRGESIKEVAGAAKGVLPVMKLLEDSFAYADQMGQRRGSGAVYLNIFHWDVIEFLDTKKINADEKSRIQSLSIGLIIPNKFFELAEKNEPFCMFAPYSVRKEYGVHLDDINIDEMYNELLANPNVKRKEMNARDMLIKISSTQLESGYPYIMFKSNANNQHALKDIGEIKMSNLCSEIFQLQETSIIRDYLEPDEINRDINCNLGSINIVNVMKTKKVRDSVHMGIEALTTVSDLTNINNAPTVKKANDELHSIGLGAMNLHGFLTKNKIAYESEEAKDFANTFFMMINFYSLEKSMLIAQDRGQAFKDFNKSEYAKGTYFTKYIENNYVPKTEKVRDLFEGIEIPTKENWENLQLQVQQHGLYNAYRLAIAPTQSISYIQNSTSSVMPVVDRIETRTYGNSTTYYPMPFLSRENMFYYKSAFNMNQFKLIDLIAEIQQHVDQGISTILYVDSNISTRELARYYIYANKKGLKSLYYTRNKRLDIEECTSCAV
ncbi:class 1b ribonucleoside-diphosphate reductase subunit alpha [Chengkuizengella sediminis]|uniref:class 1b ribonucleoside-diphosphate reductase subunit alpha n=1 Tax=Chengkuizengella sediminis TaxID=1885917 RepID=UPI00138997E9|nr:class 1b ribonucleoside-diphosphate reductase subunit alpha [Chengkuizengella sediminis]NDI35503.1 class 1b ribonucleoside-diphosphate reductase subunit alpha [Chengkuizengella sediminis]